jgi:hypothetical protein
VSVVGQPIDAHRRTRRPLVLRVALLASASMVLLGVVAGCVQAPVANPGPLALRDADSTSQAYLPDSVPVGVPALGSAPDVSTPSGAEDAPGATTPADPGAAPTTAGPATTKAAGTAPGQASTKAATTQPQAPQAATTAAPVTAAPTTEATVAKTPTAVVSIAGPGAVSLICTAASQGRTKAVLKWANSGFNASVTVNGRTTYLTNTKETSLTAYSLETTSGHGICTGRVGDNPAANSY